jgi:hypothetical protein
MRAKSMFEEEIAQGRDMIRRLEAESRLAQAERDALPQHQRVPTREALDWKKRIEQRIEKSFGADTLTRYQVAWDLYTDELERERGDEYSRSLNAFNRIIVLLEELDSRASGQSSGG